MLHSPEAGHHRLETFTEEQFLLPHPKIALTDRFGVRGSYFCCPEVPPVLVMPSQSKKASTGSRGSKFQTSPV